MLENKEELKKANLFVQILKLLVFVLYYWKPVFVRFHFPLSLVHTIILCASPTVKMSVFSLTNIVVCGGFIMLFSTNFKSDMIALSIYSFTLNSFLMPYVYDLEFERNLGDISNSLLLSLYSMTLLFLFHITSQLVSNVYK